MSLGVAAGAMMPCQAEASKPLKPDSCRVGRSGYTGLRASAVRPMGLNLPAVMCGLTNTMLLMLPTLIAETGLLSFISRHHLDGANPLAHLKEVPIKEALDLVAELVAEIQVVGVFLRVQDLALDVVLRLADVGAKDRADLDFVHRHQSGSHTKTESRRRRSRQT